MGIDGCVSKLGANQDLALLGEGKIETFLLNYLGSVVPESDSEDFSHFTVCYCSSRTRNASF